MFYCDDCANKNKWAGYYGMPQSLGACEECKRVRPCYDAPVKRAPAPIPHDRSTTSVVKDSLTTADTTQEKT